ncbi:hypothetical protein AAFX24_28110 [Vibrio mediterranei]|uniref:hypothetical protein n=1 Tax=Vibrio mediterranei TaxID=689 RepID=UPI0038CE10CD
MARLLRQANVDPKQVGLDMKREFPEASLELDRELARLACVDMGATLMAHLQSKTDHEIASSPTLKFGFERAVHRYIQAELATLSSHADQVVLLSQAYQDKQWAPMLNNPEWHKAIKTEFPSQLDAQRFLVGQIQGFTDSQLYVIAESGDNITAFDVPHPRSGDVVPQLSVSFASQMLSDAHSNIKIRLATHYKTTFLKEMGLSEWEDNEGNVRSIPLSELNHAATILEKVDSHWVEPFKPTELHVNQMNRQP